MLGISLRLEVPLLAACLRGQQPESVSVVAVPSVYMDRSTAGDHEVFKDTRRELWNLVRLEMQCGSSFGSARS